MASSSIDLLLKIQADNKASRTMEEINKDMTLLEREIQRLSQVANNSKIDPKVSSAQAKEEIKQLANEYKKLEQQSKTLATATDEALGKKSPISPLDIQAKIANLEKFNEQFQKITGAITGFGKSAIDEANSVNKLEFRIKEMASSTDEAKKSIEFINNLAIKTPQPFDTKTLLESGAILTKFKVNVEEILPKVMDLASAHKKDLASSAEVVAKALSGVRGGILGLQSEYGITKEKLIEYGAVTLQSGEIEKDDLKTKQAVVLALNELSGATEKASQGKDAAFTRLNNQVSALKVQIGKELLPVIANLAQELGNVMSGYTKLNEDTKSFLASNVLVIGGLGIVASSFMNALVQVNAFNLACQGLGITLAASGVVIGGGIIIALELLANTYIDTWRKMETQKAEKIVTETNKIANQFKSIRDIINRSKETPLEIPVSEKTKDEIEALYLKLKQVREFQLNQASDKQKEKTFTYKITYTESDFDKDFNKKGPGDAAVLVNSGLGIESSIGKTKEMTQSVQESFNSLMTDFELYNKKLSESKKGTKEYDDANLRLSETIRNLSALDKELAGDADASAEALKNVIKKAIDNTKQAQDITETTIGKTGLSIKKAGDDITSTLEKIKAKQEITDAEFNKKLQAHKDDIEGLKNYWNYYKLTYSQQLELTKTITEAKKKQSEEVKKSQQEEIKTIKENYQTFEKTQKLALTNGQITEKQYYTSLKGYMETHSAELQKTGDFNLSIQEKYNSEVIELAKKETEEKQKQLEEQKQAVIKYGQELLQQEEQNRKTREEFQKTALTSSGKASGTYQAGMIDLEAEKKEYEKAGISKNDIDKWYYSEKEKLTKTYYADLMSKEQAAQDKQIQGYNQSLANLEALNAIKIAEGLITKEQADRATANFMGQELEANRQDLEILKAKIQAGQDLTQAESARFQFLSSLLVKTKEINDQLKEQVSSTDKIASGMDKVNSSTQNLNKTLSETVGKMETIGNLSANNTGGMGNFMSVDEAFSGLPGTGDYNASTEKSNSWFNKYMDRTAGTEKTGSTKNYDDMWKKMVAIQQAYKAGEEGNSEAGIKKGDYSVYNSYMSAYKKKYGSSINAINNLSSLGEVGFDNPTHDKLAEKAGASVVSKSMEDMVKNFLTGMVSQVQKTYNNYNQSSSSNVSKITKNYVTNNTDNWNLNTNEAPPVVQQSRNNLVNWALGRKYGTRSGKL